MASCLMFCGENPLSYINVGVNPGFFKRGIQFQQWVSRGGFLNHTTFVNLILSRCLSVTSGRGRTQVRSGDVLGPGYSRGVGHRQPSTHLTTVPVPRLRGW